MEHLKSEVSGVVVFFKDAGDRVAKEELVAEVINPLADNSKDRVHPVTSSTEGILFARNVDCYARPGRILAKIAGRTPIKKKGENLLTL